jgi:hypothetical protein
MLKNTIPKIIGYYDQDGFAYCIKHAMNKSESIIQSTEEEKCCICGVYLNDPKPSE